MYKTEREYKGYNFLVSNSELFLLKMLQNKLMFSRQLNLFGVNLWFIIILQLILWLKFSLFSSFTVIGLTGQKINGWSCSDTGSEGQKLVHLTEEWWESYQLTATVYHLRQSLSWVLSKRSWGLQERALYSHISDTLCHTLSELIYIVLEKISQEWIGEYGGTPNDEPLYNIFLSITKIFFVPEIVQYITNYANPLGLGYRGSTVYKVKTFKQWKRKQIDR